MKYFITLFSAFSLLILGSCTNQERVITQEVPVLSQVYEIKNTDFIYNPKDGFNIYRAFSNTIGANIFQSDVVLIYRLVETIDEKTPVWQQIPRTIFTDKGEFEYDFDFSKEDFKIYAGGSYDLNLTPQWINNQTFRIVVVPGEYSRNVNKTMSYSKVMSVLNLDESQIKVVR